MSANISQFNWPIVGNETAVDFLQASLLNKKISSAYIFSGVNDVGKFTLAKYFSDSLIFSAKDSSETDLNQSGGDMQIVEVEAGKKNIGIAQIREFIKNLNLTSFLNSYKVGIIKNAQMLSLEAANSLLKTLEEPKDKVVIILLTSAIDKLPQTIVSRSQVINFYPVKNEVIYDYLIDKHQASRSQAKEFSRLALGRPALAVKLLKDKEFYDQHLETVKLFLSFLSEDENTRLRKISQTFSNHLFGQAGRDLALQTISVWEIVSRDMMLTEFNQTDLIRYTSLSEEIAQISQNYNSETIFQRLAQAREYLLANVSPKAVIENLAISF